MSMLRRRWLINLVLLLVAVALTLAAQLQQRQADLATRLTPLAADDIRSLRLQRAGEPALTLERNGDAWRMLEPFPADVDSALVDRLLPITAALTHRSLPADALELPPLGLDPAAIRLWLDELELRFGGTEPIDGRRYVQIGDLVHLVDDRHLPQLLAPATDYVSRRLLPPGFSPGLGNIDGRPLAADALAALAESEALRVEPLNGALSGRLLSIESADGGAGLRFLVTDGGARWSRLDQRLTYVFAVAPLSELDAQADAADTNPLQTDPFAPPIGASDGQALLPAPDEPLPRVELRPPGPGDDWPSDEPAEDLWPAPDAAESSWPTTMPPAMRTEKLRP
jgi:hypothetical protein